MGIFLLAFLARVLLFAIDYRASNYDLRATIVGDDGYYQITEGILSGKGFSGDPTPPYDPNPLRTPGYPYFAALLLAITGSYWATIVVQMLVGSGTAVLAFLLGRRLLGSLSWSAAIGVFMALEPYHVQFSFIFYTETLFIFCFLLFAWQFVRYIDRPSLQNIFFAGGLLGIATLVKTTPQFLPLLLVPLVLWHFRRNLRVGMVHAMVFGAVFLLVLAPWMYRNYQTFGVVGMTAQPAYNLIIYLVPSVLAVEGGYPIGESTFVKDNNIDENDITLATAQRYKDQAIDILTQHPVGIFKVTLISIFTFFAHDGMLTVLQHAGYIPATKLSQPAAVLLVTNPGLLVKEVAARLMGPEGLIVFWRLVNLAIGVLFVVGACMVVFRKKHAAVWIFSLVLVAYFVATTPINGLGVNARFRMPVEPFILAVAALPAIVVWRRLRHTGGRHIPHEQTLDSHPLL